MESCPAVEEGIGIVVLMPEDVMRYPLHWEVLRDGPGDDDHVKMRSRRLDYVVEVGTIEQSGDTVAPKVDNPGSAVVKRANLANHGSNTKEDGHFAAVRTVI